MTETIVGYTWEEIQAAQQRGTLGKRIDVASSGDYGADPIGNGMFKMVPSGDIVDFEERCKRLKRD